MATGYIVPTTDSIGDTLKMVLGDGLEVDASDPSGIEDAYIATYVNDSGDVVAICTCDLPFVAFTGAALSMIPADTAKSMAGGGELNPAVAGNFHEVMNICSTLMMTDSTAHLKLKDTLPSKDSEALKSGFAEGQACAFQVNVPGYGQGLIAFRIAA